jgi:hypothetical protein
LAQASIYKGNNLNKQIQLEFSITNEKEGVYMGDDQSVVWVVDNSLNKTIKDALRFGTIEHVFTDVNIDNIDLVEYARDVLKDFHDNDCLCLIGDPKLAAICVGVLAQNRPGEELRLLQFDSRTFRYNEVALNF